MSSSSGNQKASLWAVGLMLFALFFGAGNLIFPAYLGQQAGENWLSAMFGFLLTGAGLPLLGVIAIGYSGSRDVQALLRVSARGTALRLPPHCIWPSARCLLRRVLRRYRLKSVLCRLSAKPIKVSVWRCSA